MSDNPKMPAPTSIPGNASPRPGILKQESQDAPAADCASPSSYLGLNYAAASSSPKATPKSMFHLLSVMLYACPI